MLAWIEGVLKGRRALTVLTLASSCGIFQRLAPYSFRFKASKQTRPTYVIEHLVKGDPTASARVRICPRYRKRKKIDESHNYYNSAPPVKRDRTDLGYFENSPIKKGVVKVKQTSSFRGVSCCGKDRKFQARIRLNNSVKYLGRYATEVEAALVYDDAARALKGSKAPTNFKKMDAETVEHLKQAFVESGGVIPEQFQHLINRGRTKTHTTQSTTAEGKVYPEELSKFTQLALQTGPESPLPKVHGKQAPDISPQDRKSSSFKSSQVFPHPSRLETSNFNKLNRVNI
mmetsp:Transcript_17445/g.27235  ORF Transcript_17445/g.27235 Transcript_17445/m.27235 type:complete len:287 (-) Transcript_17445:141-1001(-)